jgi:HTH-type transcriptional regulator/antitoxin HipB
MLLRTPLDLGSIIRDRRRSLGLDQEELAGRVGVSRKWIIDVEKGKPRAEIGLILRTFEGLGLRLSLDPASSITSADLAAPPVAAPDIDKILERTSQLMP